MMQVDRGILESFSVGEKAKHEWFTRGTQAWEELRSTCDLVMHRKLRAEAEQVCHDISAIIRYCQADPNAVREEVAFPSIIERLVTLLKEYVQTASTTSLAAPESPKLSAVRSTFSEAHTGLTNLLSLMEAGKTKDFGLRLGVMSAVFRRMPNANSGQPP